MSISVAWRWRDSVRNVLPSRLTAARNVSGAPPCASAAILGSGTRRRRGMVNAAHQIAVVRNASRAGNVACAGDVAAPVGSPRSPG